MQIYWGHGVHGLEAASALYFGKHPSLLTLGECAMLAGVIPAPELLSPYRDPSRSVSLRTSQPCGTRDPRSGGSTILLTVTDPTIQYCYSSRSVSLRTSHPWGGPEA